MADRQTVTGYMRGSGIDHGFLDLETRFSELENTYIPTGFAKLFSRRRISRALIPRQSNPEGNQSDLVVFYDTELHQGPTGLIRCPYLVLAWSTEQERFLSLGLEHRNDIKAVIDALQNQQNLNNSEDSSRRIAIAYYIWNGEPSGLRPITITEMKNGNFHVPSIHKLFNPDNIRSHVLTVGEDDELRRFLCIFDRKLHNNGTDDCPYLIFRLGEGLRVEHATQENLMDIAEMVQRLCAEVACEADN